MNGERICFVVFEDYQWLVIIKNDEGNFIGLQCSLAEADREGFFGQKTETTRHQGRTQSIDQECWKDWNG